MSSDIKLQIYDDLCRLSWWESIWTMLHPYLTQSNRAGTLGQTRVESPDFQLIHRLDAEDSFPHHLSLEIEESSVFESQHGSFPRRRVSETRCNFRSAAKWTLKGVKLMRPGRGSATEVKWFTNKPMARYSCHKIHLWSLFNWQSVSDLAMGSCHVNSL